DTRAVETYETLAARAASYGLVDLEVQALIDMAYPVSWIDAKRCLEVVDQALRLSAKQRDPLKRARTRASCLVRRIWAGGWNARDAEDCRQALEEDPPCRRPLPGRLASDRLQLHPVGLRRVPRRPPRCRRESRGPGRRADRQPVSQLRTLVERVHPTLESPLPRRVGRGAAYPGGRDRARGQEWRSLSRANVAALSRLGPFA